MSYKVRLNKYNALLTPNELLTFMDENIYYGVYGKDQKLYLYDDDNFQQACLKEHILSDKDRLLKYQYGTCWDQVELERDWFTRNHYEFKTIFIWFLFPYENNYITHTYLVYKDKKTKEYCYFEHADFNNWGIHKFPTYKEAIEYQMHKHIEFNKQQGNVINDEVLNHLVIYEFDNIKKGLNMEEYINHILNSKVVYEKNNFCI